MISTKWQKNAVSAAVSAALCGAVAAPVWAANDTELEEVVVSGIRGSLTQSMDVKRNATGVVDAISAEDIGKFPDTNLAESLQRITGVSIDRVNGEGRNVTVRGFGGGFNLVTLNGRQMPAASVGTITGNSDTTGAQGTSRSFDFSNLASEGVGGIQVYKTGNAAVASGGIGATINIQTAKPLDGGNRSTFGAKLNSSRGGDKKVTPEVSGLYSWANDARNFGVSVFGSYQDQSIEVRGVNVSVYSLFNYDPSLSFLQNATVESAPATGQLMALPANLGLNDAQIRRKRANGMLTMQFAPGENTMITADAMYTQTEVGSQNIVPGIWFSRQFSYMQFDGNTTVATPLKLIEQIAPVDGRGKDYFFASWGDDTKDRGSAFGLNVKHKMDNGFSLDLDGAIAEAKSGGNGPLGYNSWRINLAAAGAGWQAAYYGGGVPTATVGVVENLSPAGGNANGALDAADVSTQTFRTVDSSQKNRNSQLNLTGAWENGEGVSAKFGVGYLATKMQQFHAETQDFLGGWGVGCAHDLTLPGTPCNGSDISAANRAAITTLNVPGRFQDLNFSGYPSASAAAPPGYVLTTLGTESFFVDPYSFGSAVNGYQSDLGGPVFNFNNLTPAGYDNNTIKEDIKSAYAQVKFDRELGGKPTQTVLGVRYEQTTAKAAAQQVLVESVTWQSDNDYARNFAATLSTLGERHKYNNVLPNLDFSIDLSKSWKARASVSQTIARPAYNNMFITTAVNTPPTPTALGGVPTASKGSVVLDPLKSTNFDVSVEWYYGPGSYASVGFFNKSVKNFLGTATSLTSLFGLRDVSSGAAGTLSGQAAAALTAGGWTVNEQNLFTMSAILANPADFPNGAADYLDPSQPGGSAQALDAIAAYDINPTSTDPLFNFSLSQPVNNRTSKLHGVELAWQHFFGQTGFGFQANATLVGGDVSFDNGASPSIAQFALEGLSDSANFVAIYEKHGVSARVAYNWRDAFLNSTVHNGQAGLPEYVGTHKQIDFNVTYNVNEQFAVSLDGINITGEGSILYSRTRQMQWWNGESDPRYVLGARYRF